MDFTLAFYLTVGFGIGFSIGGGLMTLVDRWRLHKKIMQEIPNHPEYKIYKDILDDQIPEKKQTVDEKK